MEKKTEENVLLFQVFEKSKQEQFAKLYLQNWGQFLPTEQKPGGGGAELSPLCSQANRRRAISCLHIDYIVPSLSPTSCLLEVQHLNSMSD